MCYECAVKNSTNNFNCPMRNEPLSGYKFVFDDIYTKPSNFNILNDHSVAKNNIQIQTDDDNINQNLLINRSNSCILNSKNIIEEKSKRINECNSSSFLSKNFLPT